MKIYPPINYWIIAVVLCGQAGTALTETPSASRNAGVTSTEGGRKVNRTVPKVTPPKTDLEFSAPPTTKEISEARLFDERLVPIGGQPAADENAAIGRALLDYMIRRGTDDFSPLTGFLEKNPNSSWTAALQTCLGIEYYNTAHYSLALDAWEKAWSLGQKATDAKGRFLADRAVCELAGLYSRLGRMMELEALLESIEHRVFIGGASERINIARDVLANMKSRPEVCFRCGPLALHSIKQSQEPQAPTDIAILNSASTTNGFSLAQVGELSKKVGLNYQMAFRGKGADFVTPCVVHWKAGHYAAIVRQEGNRYLVEDPTFIRSIWVTRPALESEASGYCLVPSGNLPPDWRTVNPAEGGTIWGKGFAFGSDADQYAANSLQTGTCSGDGMGMPVSSMHLMLANVQIRDTPVGYVPPVGPPVHFTVRYNHRDYLQPASSVSKLLGPKWTHDWNESLKPEGANMRYFVGGGGARVFIGFNPATQSWVPNQYDQTVLRRLSPDSYELVWPDGSKKFFGPANSSAGLLLSRVADPAGNSISLTYDSSGRLVALTDAIGQVTTIFYEHPTNPDLITKVADPFGRFATFAYASLGIPWNVSTNGLDPNQGTNHIHIEMLTNITDVLGLESKFTYQIVTTLHREDDPDNLENNHPGYVDIIQSMTTPYGTTSFVMLGPDSNTVRVAQTQYPDGSRERVEFNQASGLGPAPAEPVSTVPAGMVTGNVNLFVRNTYYWSRTAATSSFGDYTKARIYHWLHGPNAGPASGILESIREPLENRVWYNYEGQTQGPGIVGANNQPTKIGRVLDDGQTQLYTMGYNLFGKVTNSIDPLGRTFSFSYATNGIDLLEVRQTRAANNELLVRMSYNAQHLPLTVVDSAGQTNTFTYNARGQVLTVTNPKGETTAYTYDAEGKPFAVDGPLPGTNDIVRTTYDVIGRARTVTGVSGYKVTFDYDDLDRITKITHPDGTFEQFTYDRLDLSIFRDRAGHQTSFERDSMRQVKKQTDPLGRVTRFDWCRCGQMKSLTDPMGNTTTWLTDVQGRPTAKRYADGSQVTYQYENASSRLRFIIDEKQQITQFAWNRDNTLKSVTYGSALIPTPGVRFTYDPDYERVLSMTDGIGTTRYTYNPFTTPPTLGAGSVSSVDGPLPNDTVTYAYDELNRLVHRAINGVSSSMTLDGAGRLIGVTNALGSFAYGYDGATMRLLSKSQSNGQTEERAYGDNAQDRTLQRITHALGATKVSEFLYGHDITRGRITTWSQQTGAQSPSLFTFGYDAVNQLLSATVTNAGTFINAFSYVYDPSGNRIAEQVGASDHTATYNGLNEIRTTTAPGMTRTNEWDAQDHLVAVNAGNQRTEFTYDGMDRIVAIRQLVNGAEASLRRLLWCGAEVCEERNAAGAVTKQYFPQGVKIESGPAAGTYFYTRDHLGSIRELTDSNGNVRARYSYDPFGRPTKLSGDLEADFGFAGMFWSPETSLFLTHYRAYDPGLGRWLSRDPLPGAETLQGPNLYAYVFNDPVNQVDPEGLSTLLKCFTPSGFPACAAAGIAFGRLAGEKVSQGVQHVGRTTWQGLQRCGSAIGNFFSRTSAPTAPPSPPPPQIPPAMVDRMQFIRENAANARSQLQSYINDPWTSENLRKLGTDYIGANGRQYWATVFPGPPQLWLEVAQTFDDVAAIVSQRFGVSLETARAWLSSQTGYFP